MTDPSVLSDLGGSHSGHRRGPRRRRGGRGLLALVVVLVVLAVVVYAGGRWLKHRLDGPADYAGPGTGRVTFTITEGESVPQMGAALQKLDVVKSSAAFVSAASTNSGATGIQPGAYLLKKRMKAADVVSILVNPKNMVQDTVTIPEGKRADDIVALIAQHSDFSEKSLRAVLAHPEGLGLPSYAHGDPEGFLFPATYTITPGETPRGLIKAMVTKWHQETAAIHLDSAAKAVNLDPEQAITVASILEYEASRAQDYPKVARAIYNRLKADMPLQSDATVAYANKITGQVWTTAAQRAVASAYNTYTHKGLPPGPIGNPGIETINAALHPAQGPWLYWVVVNLRTGKTVFSTTYAQHQAATEQLRRYCQTSSAC
jgi:UPF0755 protein